MCCWVCWVIGLLSYCVIEFLGLLFFIRFRDFSEAHIDSKYPEKSHGQYKGASKKKILVHTSPIFFSAFLTLFEFPNAR